MLSKLALMNARAARLPMLAPARLGGLETRARLPPGGLPAPHWLQVRPAAFGLIPPDQYESTSPKLYLSNMARDNWEIWPLFINTAVVLSILFFSIIWAIRNKVDVVFSTHNRRNISRTMNLRRPTTHKIFLFGQRYEPWPEMQDVLDKMAVAERRALMKATNCGYEAREGKLPFQ